MDRYDFVERIKISNQEDVPKRQYQKDKISLCDASNQQVAHTSSRNSQEQFSSSIETLNNACYCLEEQDCYIF